MSVEHMFCPKCGTEGQQANAYCKRCGEWLPNMIGGLSRMEVIGGKTPEQKLRGLTNNSAASVALTLFAAIVVLISLDSISGLLILFVPLACIMAVALQAINFYVGRKIQQDLKRSHSDLDQLIALGAKQNQLDLSEANAEQFINVQSVTENTTRTLEPAGKKTSQSE